MTIKTLIVDDEPLALDILETFIAKMPNLELVARCNNALEGIEALKNHEVDLMFLDIQMPQITGIEFLRSLRNPPAVVFTTAFPDFALEGFELDAVDYLLKPISMDRFMKAVSKATERIMIRKQGTDTIEEIGDDYFFVKADKKLIKVNFSDIIYIEGLKDYVIIRQENSRVIALQTMKSLEDKLHSSNFRRVHRSYIVNLGKVLALDGNTLEVMEKGQVKVIPIGKNYRDELLDMINEKKL
ncbi:MAG TPA: LytTR family DNA-binding domain-containing protein [Saprospiraceae bacterium]|nr:LytTR family DNA-binding domain-containing protein [Saprospiraceae bacterium]HPN70059.1 LytTR family DNA-binding domain-containing protein [Saprospiraceae bacterium]